MRQILALTSLVLAILVAGCGGGGVEGDLEKSGDELRKEAAKMSDAELEKKLDELEKYAKGMEKSGDDEPSKAEMEKAVKLMEITGIYGAELMKRRMK